MALTAEREQILNAIANDSYLKRPHPMKQGPNIDKTMYCSFHRDYGHTIEQCQKLKDEIEYHIKKGYLKEYICRDQSGRRQKDIRASGSKPMGKLQIIDIIHTIIGATKEWSQSKSKRRQHLRSVMTIEESFKRPQKTKIGRLSFIR